MDVPRTMQSWPRTRLGYVGERARISAMSIDLVAAGIVATGLLMRLWWVFDSAVAPDDDAAFYHRHATELLDGRGFTSPTTGEPTAFLPPGYPVALAGAYAVLGESWRSGALLNIALAAVTMVFTYLTARHYFGVNVGRVAAGLIALFPSQVLYTPALMPDGLAQALVAALIWCALVKEGRTSTIAVGVLSGLLALTAPREVLLLAAVVVAWGLRDSWQGLLRGAAVAGLAALIVLPWTVRNAVVMDAFVPVSTNSGINLWIGNNPAAYGSWMAWDGSGRQGTWSYPEDEVNTDRELQREALQHIVNNPVETVLGWPNKLRYTLDQDYGYVSHFAITPREHQIDLDSVIGLELLIDNAFTGVLVLAALTGTAVVIRRERPAELVLILAGLMLPTIIFLGLDRYHITAIPVLAILASAGAVTLVTRGVATAAPTGRQGPARRAQDGGDPEAR